MKLFKRPKISKQPIVNELVSEIMYHHYLYADDYTDPQDMQYYNGMIDGLTFALSIIDKKAIPAPPKRQSFNFIFEDEDAPMTADEVLFA